MKPEHLDLLLDLLVEERERLRDAARDQAEELATLRRALKAAETTEDGLRLDLEAATQIAGRAIEDSRRLSSALDTMNAKCDQLEAELAAALGELRRLKAPAVPVGA